MKKYMIILATILLLAFGSTIAFAGPTAGPYQSSPSMQQQPMYSSPSSTSTSPSSSSEQSNTITPTEQNTSAIVIENFAFTPATITIPMGTTVTWTNQDSTAHTVTGDTSDEPSSGTLQPGQSYSFTFTSAGTFLYHCTIHPMMKGTVVVTETSSSSANSKNSTPSSTPTPMPTNSTPSTPTATSTAPTSLPNTGAGNVLLVFGAATVAGTIGYTLYLLRKAPLR